MTTTLLLVFLIAALIIAAVIVVDVYINRTQGEYMSFDDFIDFYEFDEVTIKKELK